MSPDDLVFDCENCGLPLDEPRENRGFYEFCDDCLEDFYGADSHD